jgi:transcriptional regulator
VVELDPIKLLDKIEAAQKAIADRLKNAMNPINANEQQAIENARRNLYFLKKHPAA